MHSRVSKFNQKVKSLDSQKALKVKLLNKMTIHSYLEYLPPKWNIDSVKILSKSMFAIKKHKNGPILPLMILI